MYTLQIYVFWNIFIVDFPKLQKSTSQRAGVQLGRHLWIFLLQKSGLLMACCPKAHLTMLLGKIYLSCNEACLQSHTYGVSWFLSSLSVCRWAELLRTQINLVVVGDLSLFRILLRCYMMLLGEYLVLLSIFSWIVWQIFLMIFFYKF